jgi:hypothetical protein
MTHRAGKIMSGVWSSEGGPYVLLVSLFVTVFVISPLIYAGMVPPIILQTAFWLVIVAGVFNTSLHPLLRLFALTIALLSTAWRWLGPSFFGKTIAEVDIFLSVGMLLVFTLLTVHSFLVTGRAWAHRIAAAVAVYLLLGLIWARLYELLEQFAPGSFRIPEGEHLSTAGFIYFSFVTLATIGYGDFSPVHIIARNLAVLEAITGQLYMVILISRLVSERLAERMENKLE